MSQKLREKVSCYVPKDLAAHYRERAAHEGISLSAYLVRTLAVEDQIDELREWISARFDRLDEHFKQAAVRVPEQELLRLAELHDVPRDTLLAILRDLKEEIEAMTPKQREYYTARGRELLAKTNGAGK